MSKLRKADKRIDRQWPRGVHLAGNRGRLPGRWTATRRFKLLLVLLAFAAIGSGFLFTRTRMPGSLQYSAHDGGAQYIPGTSVRFGQEEPANGNNDASGEAVEPDTTEVPAPEAAGGATGSKGGAVAQ
jgi:hypothetical protein